MDTSDTADIAATYADPGGGYRNGSHDVVDGHILPPPSMDVWWSAAARSA
jgi:hypothetical protein